MTLILGRKQGMTHVFREDGTLIGVTVVAAGPCTVTQVRTEEKDGYEAVQLGFGDTIDKRTSQPLRGNFASVGCARSAPARGAPQGPAQMNPATRSRSRSSTPAIWWT